MAIRMFKRTMSAYTWYVRFTEFTTVHLESCLRIRIGYFATFPRWDKSGSFSVSYSGLQWSWSCSISVTCSGCWSEWVLGSAGWRGIDKVAVWKLAIDSWESGDSTIHDCPKSVEGGTMEMSGRVELWEFGSGFCTNESLFRVLSEDSTRSITSGSTLGELVTGLVSLSLRGVCKRWVRLTIFLGWVHFGFVQWSWWSCWPGAMGMSWSQQATMMSGLCGLQCWVC